MFKLLKLFLFFFISYCSTAQSPIAIDGKIKAKIINQNNGHLLVATSKATYGINPKTREILWENKKLKNVIFSTYQELADTPLVLFEKKTLINSKFLSRLFNTKGPSFIIINSETGTQFFDSAELGYKSVVNLEFYPRDQSILFSGVKNKNLFLCRLDLNNKSKLWEIKLGNNDILKASKREFFGHENFFRNISGDIFWVLDGKLLKINAEDGKILSETKRVKDIGYQPKNDLLFCFTESINATKANKETALTAYKSESMTFAWNDTIKVYGKIKNALIQDDQLILITQVGFDALDLITGQKQWHKKEKLPLIKTIIPSYDNEYLVIQDQFLIKIDSRGKKVWNKPVKIFKTDDIGMHYIEQNENHILSITPSFMHKINPETGKNLWHKPKTLNNSTYAERSLELSNNRYRVWFDNKEQAFLIYSNSNLFYTKINDTLQPKLLHTFPYKEIPKLELRENGYFFHQNNNFIFFDKNTRKKYDTLLTKMIKPSFVNSSKKLGKQGYRIYKATLGLIPKQIDNTLKSVLVSQDVGIFTSSTSYIYGSYHNYTSLYSDFTNIPDIDMNSYLEEKFRIRKKGRTDIDFHIFATPADEKLHFKLLVKESGKVRDLSSVKLNSKDIIIDQQEQLVYMFEKNKITIIALDDN